MLVLEVSSITPRRFHCNESNQPCRKGMCWTRLWFEKRMELVRWQKYLSQNPGSILIFAPSGGLGYLGPNCPALRGECISVSYVLAGAVLIGMWSFSEESGMPEQV